MSNNGTVVVGAIASAALILTVIMFVNSSTENVQGGIIVSDEEHTHTVGDIIGSDRENEDVVTKIENIEGSIGDVVTKVENIQTIINDVTDSELTPIQIFEKTEESVVQVNILRGATDGGVGSGFVYSNDGYIITNQHVVKNANKVTVTFLDGESYIANVIGRDQDLDIAVIKVETDDTTKLKSVVLADSSELKVGEKIIAIGNPFGLSGSMTSGIISQIGRLLPQETGYSIPDVIQTDAAINPGNSGGPLINMKGEVVGINTAIQSTTGEFTGIGFAVPSNTVKKVVPVLIENGEFLHPWMGISGTDVDPELAKVRELDSSKGFVVVSVIEGSPAEKAGMKGVSQTREIDGREFPMNGDIILEIDGKTVRKISDILVHLQREKSVGDEMIITVLRTGVTMDLTMILEERPR
tara:strand:- start:3473 stop:4708 length:1236 start_codon:yes stop_codon:yes gene_type:complete